MFLSISWCSDRLAVLSNFLRFLLSRHYRVFNWNDGNYTGCIKVKRRKKLTEWNGWIKWKLSERDDDLFIYRGVSNRWINEPSTKVDEQLRGQRGTVLKGLMKTRVPKLGQWRNPRACNLLRIHSRSPIERFAFPCFYLHGSIVNKQKITPLLRILLYPNGPTERKEKKTRFKKKNVYLPR